MLNKNHWRLALAVAMLLSIPLLQACGSGDGARGAGMAQPAKAGEKVKLTWSTWGNPGELTRLQDFTKEYNSKHPNVEVEFIPVPSEYEQKMLTQLSGGTAPDVFYANPDTLAKLLDIGAIAELTPYVKGPDSPIKETDFFSGLWGPAKMNDKLYGVPVDCNPIVLWYNKKLLLDAGVSEMPADVYEKGNWNWSTFQGMLDKLRASGKHGLIQDNSWYRYYSFVTANGGSVYDDKGDFIGDKDPKAVEAYKFLYDNMQKKNITFSGSLPKGQGSDAMFMSSQVGFVSSGRWYLPIFKQNKDLQYDIVPFPTNTGKKMEPASVTSAYMVMNKATKHPQEAYRFLSEFVSKDGQMFRLQGGGNAVPSVQGADQVVAEGNLPEHYKYFLDVRNTGYVLMPAEAGVPGLTKTILDEMSALWLNNGRLDDGLQNVGIKANRKIKEFRDSKK